MLDGVLAAVVAAASLVVLVHPGIETWQPGAKPVDQLGYALVAAATLPLTGRRLWPLPVLAIVVGAVAVYLAFGYPSGPILAAVVVAMYTVAVRQPLRRSLVACAVAVVVLFAHYFVAVARGTGTAEVLTLVWTGWLLLPWAAGTAVRTYRESSNRAREEAARDRAYEERLRVAREVHDVVGHGLSAINMQAGVALHVLDRRPEQARTALDAIRRTSKDALDDLRGTLAVFRHPEGAGRGPEPGLDQLDALVDRVGASGLPVDLEVTGEPTRLAAATDLAAYRIVQEALTNVVRHAGRATANVAVQHGVAEVTVEITDNGRAGAGDGFSSSTGYGIAGMRERAAAVGGTLDAGPRPEGGFRVRARLPAREVPS